MFAIVKIMFLVLITSIAKASYHTKCVSLSNQKCKIQPTVINLHPNEYSQELYYYPFAVKLDKCAGSFNTLNDLSNKTCAPNKKEYLKYACFQYDYKKKMNQKF